MGVSAAILGSAVIGGGASVLGGIMGSHAQKDAAKKASKTQMNMYNTTRGDLLPYNTAGQSASNALMSRLPQLTSPIKLDQAWLDQTPGYQFNLSQGLRATQNNLTASGLGSSGATAAAAAKYATGLADSTYLDQFNAEMAQRNQQYNMLMGPIQIGENAAAQTGNYGTQTAGQIGSNQIGAGNAAAGAWVGGASAVGNAVNNAANGLVSWNMFNQWMNQGQPSSTGGYSYFGGPR